MGELRLHLGCGPDVVPGWENLDRSPALLLVRFPWLRAMGRRAGVLAEGQGEGFPPGAIRADLNKGVPYPDGSARYVYSGHMIEHLSRWQGLAVLRECHRVLVPGGVLRLATPDLRDLVDSYLSGEFPPPHDAQPTAADSFMSELGTHAEPQANTVRRYVWRNVSGAPHQWLYDAASLTALLGEAGFADVARRTYREGAVPDLEQLEHRPRSLFLEATR